MSNQRTFTEHNEMKATALAKVDEHATAITVTPLVLLQQAIDKGHSVDDLRGLMDLQERYERNLAAERYAHALTTFQAKCPRIVKDRTADTGKYKYKYAGYDDLMKQVGPLLNECGLALSFSTENQDKGIRVTLKIRHGTHCEEHTLDVPVPAMNVNDTQRYGAALSYAKRYAMCAALNIVVTDEDDDAASAYDPISIEQENELAALIEEKGADKAKFLKWMGVEKLMDIPARDFQKAVSGLRRK